MPKFRVDIANWGIIHNLDLPCFTCAQLLKNSLRQHCKKVLHYPLFRIVPDGHKEQTDYIPAQFI